MRGSLNRVIRNAGWFLGSRGVTGLLSLFYLAIAARTLGLTDFGQFTLVLSFAQATAGLVSFQTWQIVIRYGLPLLHQGARDKLDDLIAFSVLLDVVSAIVGAAVAIIGLILLAPVFAWSERVLWEAGLFCAAMLLSLRSTPTGMLRLHDSFALAAVADSVMPVMRLLGAVVVAVWAPGVTGFLVAWGVAEMATAAAFWLLALRRHRLDWRGPDWRRGAVRRVMTDHPDLWRFAWLTNAASSLGVMAKQVSLLLVGSVGGPAAAGAFRIAAQIAQAMTKLTLALSRAAFPELIRASGQADAQFQRLMRRITRIATIGATGSLLLVMAFGPSLLHFLTGEDLSAIYWPMVLLTAAAALDLGGATLEPALAARGRAGFVVVFRAVAVAFQLGLLAALLPAFGALGAGWATLAGSLIALVLAVAGVRRPARSGLGFPSASV